MSEKEQNFFEFVYDVFYKFSQTRPENSKIMFSRKIQYPVIKFARESEIVIPLPKIQDDKYVFEGMLFDNTPTGRQSLWSLFLATIYHLAAHVGVSRYFVYEEWIKNKTNDLCLRVIDFIEDIKVEKFIIDTNHDVWENLKNIDSKLLSCDNHENMYNNKMQHDLKIRGLDNKKIIEKIKKEIIEKTTDSSPKDSSLLFADFIYRHRGLLPNKVLPYWEHHKEEYVLKVEEKHVEFVAIGLFEEQSEKLDELWMINEQTKSRILRKHSKNLKDLNFDAIVIPSGNLHDFVEIKERIRPMLRRIIQQIRLVTNVIDDPTSNQIGYVDMQMAIQAIASEGQYTDIFDRDEPRRSDEAWAILIDRSASMGLRFDQIKEFVVCISESANELTGKSGAWGLYSFDNNFQILKDFNEKYNQEIQARIGGLQTNGLSLMPDAIELIYRILSADSREKKYIFVITDGHPSGYERIQEQFNKVSKKIEMSGVILIGIGVSKYITRVFRNNARSSDLRQLVSKFITAYKTAASS